MNEPPIPVFRTVDTEILIGTMVIYDSYAEALQGIPQQWRAFRASHPALGSRSGLCGASPCTDDGKLHYLTGVAPGGPTPVSGEPLTLVAGEYAVVRLEEPSELRGTWRWLLQTWLPGSGRREKHAPELERFSEISDSGLPVGPVEIWIPLEPLEAS